MPVKPQAGRISVWNFGRHVGTPDKPAAAQAAAMCEGKQPAQLVVARVSVVLHPFTRVLTAQRCFMVAISWPHLAWR